MVFVGMGHSRNNRCVLQFTTTAPKHFPGMCQYVIVFTHVFTHAHGSIPADVSGVCQYLTPLEVPR